MTQLHIGPRYLGFAVCRDCGARVAVHFRKADDRLVPRAHARHRQHATRCFARAYVGPIREHWYAWMAADPDFGRLYNPRGQCRQCGRDLDARGHTYWCPWRPPE